MNIILGITGSIAAYKAPELVRRLRERGADVQVVMTASAREFVTETTLQAVSARPVRTSLWDREAEAAMGHIELGRWADLVLIAPATAEIMSRLATGSAHDLLTTLCLVTEAPVALAPAMNRVMWASKAVQANRQTLEERGLRFLGPGSGAQACGEFGEGRMLDPEDIVGAVMREPVTLKNSPSSLAGSTVMITAGPTREAIDPVRFISNRSSGRMGYALAQAALERGARVILISGPVSIEPPEGADVVQVESATEMYEQVLQRVAEADIFIGAAAIADYRPARPSPQKLKKGAEESSIDLVKAPDTLASVAALADPPFTVGFAAETEKLREHAQAKLVKKKLDLIVANEVGEGRGFDCDENAVEVYWEGGERAFPKTDKQSLAVQLVDFVAERYRQRRERGDGRRVAAAKD